MSDLKNFLGSSAEFKTVKGYMYVDGLPGPGAMSLKTGGTSLLDPDPTAITLRPRPDIRDWGGGPGSVGEIDLLDQFNGAGPFSLDYAITMSEITITKNSDQAKKTITADMVIMLPLEFTLSGTVIPVAGKNYIALPWNDMLPQLGDGDLFQRNDDTDTVLKEIESVKLRLNNIVNDVLPAITLLTTVPHEDGTVSQYIRVVPPAGNEEITINDPPRPFNPTFTVLLPIGQGATAGTLTIGRGADVFDFLIVAEAKTGIEYAVTF
jgi:hypothetical protein